MTKNEHEFKRPHLTPSDYFEMRLSGLLDLYLPQADHNHPKQRTLFLREDHYPAANGTFAKIQEEPDPDKRPGLHIVDRQEHDVQAHSSFDYERKHYVHTNMVIANGRIMTVGGKQERVETARFDDFDDAATQLQGLVPFDPTAEEQARIFGKPESMRTGLAAALARVLKGAR
jgi:hypothetical protein